VHSGREPTDFFQLIFSWTIALISRKCKCQSSSELHLWMPNPSFYILCKTNTNTHTHTHTHTHKLPWWCWTIVWSVYPINCVYSTPYMLLWWNGWVRFCGFRGQQRKQMSGFLTKLHGVKREPLDTVKARKLAYYDELPSLDSVCQFVLQWNVRHHIVCLMLPWSWF